MSITPVYLLNTVPSAIVPYTDGARGSWIGAYPYLDTPDADASYFEPNPGDIGAFVGVILPAFTAGETVTVEWQMRFEAVGPVGVSFRLYDASLSFTHGGGAGYLGQIDSLASSPAAGSWVQASADPFPVTPQIAAAAGRGDLVLARSSRNPQALSFMYIAGGPAARPLRWRQRNDGLSGGPRQARGVTSQQVGRGHRGYL